MFLLIEISEAIKYIGENYFTEKEKGKLEQWGENFFFSFSGRFFGSEP